MRARPVIATGARVTGSLKDTALITGASAGIGLELAKLFAADGHDLVLVARRADALQKLADSLRTKHNIAVRIWPADLADPRAPLQLHERAVAEGVAVDILVNNAGFGAIGHFHALPPERQLGIIDVNMRALTEMTYHFLPAMRGLPHYKLPDLQTCIDANLAAARLTNPAVRCVGLSLNTSALDPAAAERTLREIELKYGLPAVDPLRTGVGKLVDVLAKM